MGETDTGFDWLNVAMAEIKTMMRMELGRVCSGISITVIGHKDQLTNGKDEPKEIPVLIATRSGAPIMAVLTLVHLPLEDRTIYCLHAIMALGMPPRLLWTPLE